MQPPRTSTPLLLLAIICRRATKSLTHNMILCEGNGMEIIDALHYATSVNDAALVGDIGSPSATRT